MDILLALLALFNVISMAAVYSRRSFPDNSLPWVVFAFAVLASELAWIWLPLQAVVALLFVIGGALDSALGWIALVVLVLSWPGLLRSLWLGLGSGSVVEAALVNGLGADYRSRIPAAIRSRLRERITFQDWNHPLRMARPDVEVIHNIAYASGGIRQRLDIYRPRVLPPQGCPVILQIHGGGWIFGNKDDQALPLMYHLASKGWICVAANYRLSPSVGFPTHLHDCKAALAWIRAHGREYGMDPSFVAVTGGSAGGHLCALMGLTANRKDLQPGHEDADTSVQACVPFYGVYDMLNRAGARPSSDKFFEFLADRVLHASPTENPERWELASPLSQVHADAPPFMVLHGASDSLAPVVDARAFVRRMREVSRSPVVYVELAGAEHGFEVMHSPRAEYSIDGVERFLEWARATRG